MQGILYEESTVWLFLFVTVVMGGWGAWMIARGIALGWRPYWQVVVALLLLGVAVRFIHHALFEGTFVSPHYYVVDTIVLLAVGSLGYRTTRARQMTTQYRWLYERTGPLTWRTRGGAGA
ncbi:hypothetical protein OPKNFCMD_3724 [Methylobacterium crusticola]|uniref:DUF6867 domain-containing protein n=1 Tax=Methylobacterium crusticola TaxID=1697972 RepID=A0ABQ4R0B2_9HYPH|nr:hypothetical protein [Methylobacterium crusticola]GJD50973.1 hypothetical protein OPKNFCMD_3724 [Methylobacterium crusticola]